MSKIKFVLLVYFLAFVFTKPLPICSRAEHNYLRDIKTIRLIHNVYKLKICQSVTKNHNLFNEDVYFYLEIVKYGIL